MIERAEPTLLDGVRILYRSRHTDGRGSFTRAFCRESLERFHLNADCVQVNVSHSENTGTLRGLHFQYPPDSETKIIACVRGRIFDVAVDLRPDSATFLKWFGLELGDQSNLSLYIPPGFAHGLLTLVPETTVLYASSTQWSPGNEDGLRFDDPLIGIDWPATPHVLSEKDLSWPPLAERADAVRMRMGRVRSAEAR